MPNPPPQTRAMLAAWSAGALLGAAILIASGGCQAIVGNEIPAFTCTGRDARTCPVGQYCREAGCVPCEARDVCDGFDNDCNGEVDDGELSDRDGDGYTFCGVTDEATRQIVFDCDDNDPAIHPTATEVCNGKDDDCNQTVDDEGRACAPGETCAPRTLKCIDTSKLCSPQSCAAPRVCDAQTEECVIPDALKPGDACTSGRACETGICGDTSTLTQTVTSVTGNICTKTCCTSNDCPREFVCFGTGGSGNFCVPKTALNIRGALGLTLAGDPCMNDFDCRSGACDASKRCIDTCCTDASCKSGTTCRVAAIFRGKSTSVCQTPAGKGEQNDSCSANADCKSNYCHVYPGNLPRCAAPCCGSQKCGIVDFGFFLGQSVVVCANGSPNAPEGFPPVSLCNTEKRGRGTAAVSANCSAAADCASDICLTVTLPDGTPAKRCSDVCCTDADCTTSGWVCRPMPDASGVFLRCAPK